jgi:hypothetical protein
MTDVFTLAVAPKFHDDDEVMMTYNVLVSKLVKMEKVFKKFHLEWEEEECIESDEDGEPLEWAGTLTGVYKDVLAFLKTLYPGDKLKELNSYITKI